MKNIYYNLLAFQNNIIINFLILGNIFYPNYFNDKIIYYKNLGDEYYKYVLLLNLRDKIEKTYNVDIINIGLKLYEKYKSISMKNDDNDNDVLSDISDMSDLSKIDD
jgi:hypothetical protein